MIESPEHSYLLSVSSRSSRYLRQFFLLILLVFGFNLQSVFASNRLQITSPDNPTVDLSINDQGYEVGGEVTFGVKIFNSNPNWIHVLPADLAFDSEYMEWLGSTPEADVVLENSSHWNDLTITQGNIAPYRFAMLWFKFRALKSTEMLAEGATVLRLVIHNAKAGPEQYDTSANESTLPDMILAIPVKIQEPITQTATPTIAASPTRIVIATATMPATETAISTQVPSQTSTYSVSPTPTSSKTIVANPTESNTATPTAPSTPTASETVTPSSTQASTVTSTPSNTSTIPPNPTQTEVPKITATPTLPAIPKGVERTVDAVTVTWQTTDESNIIGFDVIRWLITGEKELVNKELIPAKEAGNTKGAVYAVSDPNYALLQDSGYELDIQLTSGKSVTRTLGMLKAANLTLSDSGVDLSEEGINISWRTSDETYMKGFDILRYDLPPSAARSNGVTPADEPPLTQINEAMVPALFSGENAGASYKYVDHGSRIGGGGGYGYKLRILLRNGEILIVDVGVQEPVEIQIHAEISRTNESQVNIQWITYNESFIKGFHILRQESQSDLVRLTSQMIPAVHAGEAMGTEYKYADSTAPVSNNYTYLIELVLADESNVQIELSTPANQQIFLPLINRGPN